MPNEKRIFPVLVEKDPDTGLYVGSVPGRVVDVAAGHGVTVLTGNGAIVLNQVQLEGGEISSASEILNSISLTLGR